MSPIAITRSALLTPLDAGGGDTWDAICAGKRITDRIAIPDELLHADTTLDRSIRLALAAAKRIHPITPDTRLFCGTSKGPITTYLAACDQLRNKKPLTQSQATQIALGAGAMAAILRERLRLQPPAHTSVAACASGLHALHRAAQAITRNECNRALVVAADASLHPLFSASFERLGVLAPINEHGTRTCEPFAETGDGFFLFEAAAAILLESAETLQGCTPIAWLEKSWIGADSTDLIAIDPHTQTLECALKQCPGHPAFIHAHATGTSHDRYELAAIQNRFGKSTPVFSHKKWLGHSLGAAGLVSVVISATCHQNYRTPTGHAVAKGKSSVTIAQGFGGHVGIVTLRGA